jgi:peptidyl-prolyl cis-trans isomerase A (cyclophilin A)
VNSICGAGFSADISFSFFSETKCRKAIGQKNRRLFRPLLQKAGLDGSSERPLSSGELCESQEKKMNKWLCLVACLGLLVLGCEKGGKESKSSQKTATANAARHNPTPPAAGSQSTISADKKQDKGGNEAPVKAPAADKNTSKAPPLPPLKKTGGRGPLVTYSPEHVVEFTKDLGTGTLMAIIETNHGTLNCELFEKKAPKTVANFVGLARGKREYIDVKTGQPTRGAYFDGTTCHRLIPNFMMQCGDPTASGSGGPGYRFPDEFHPELRHTTGGMLSMANSGPSTNGSQFFVTERATPHLDNRHAVFGRCKEIELIKKITRLPKMDNDPSRPKEPVVLKKVTIVRI